MAMSSRNSTEAVGTVLQTLRDEKLAENTLVIFTSDNGPWLTQCEQGGSAGLLKDGKGSTWEGGMREPAIAWWPGTVPAGSRIAGTGQHARSVADALCPGRRCAARRIARSTATTSRPHSPAARARAARCFTTAAMN